MPVYEFTDIDDLLRFTGPPPYLPPRNLPCRSDIDELTISSEHLPKAKKNRRAEEKEKVSNSCCFLCISILVITTVLISITIFLLQDFSVPSRTVHSTKSSDCPFGYTFYSGTNHCYKASVVPVPFEAASSSCLADNAHLTSIHSLPEFLFISGLYHISYHDHNRQNDLKTKYTFWIGLTQTNGSWQWMDGSELDYENWNSRVNSSENRVIVDPTAVRWYRNKQEVAGFVCKKKLGDEKKTSDNSDKCMPGYQWFQETRSCYWVSVQEVQFPEATRICESDNAKLVSIHSSLENILLNGLIIKALEDNDKKAKKITFWIGLAVLDKKYTWIDGSPVDFLDWFPSEPSYKNGSDWFTWTYWTAWKSSEETMKRGFICKYDPS